MINTKQHCLRHAGLSLFTGVALSTTAFTLPASAEESFSQTRVSGAYSWSNEPDTVFGTGTTDDELGLIEFEHYGVWKYGDNYIDVNLFHGDGVKGIPLVGLPGEDHTYFALWVSRLSLSKTTGHSFDFGLIKDVYVAGRIERSDYFDYTAEHIGLSVDLKIPGAAFFETDLYYRNFDFDGYTGENSAILSRTFAIFPFKLASQDFKYEQLLLVTFQDNDRDTEVYSRSDVTMRIPSTTLDVGIRVEYHSFGGIEAIDDTSGTYDRTTPYAIARWNF